MFSVQMCSRHSSGSMGFAGFTLVILRISFQDMDCWLMLFCSWLRGVPREARLGEREETVSYDSRIHVSYSQGQQKPTWIGPERR